MNTTNETNEEVKQAICDAEHAAVAIGYLAQTPIHSVGAMMVLSGVLAHHRPDAMPREGHMLLTQLLTSVLQSYCGSKDLTMLYVDALVSHLGAKGFQLELEVRGHG